jgi:16S rRNA (cytosine1402-N4)-methyltransferase
MAHKSVLLKEVIEGLDLQDGDVYLDATVGSGGHMEAVWNKMKDRVDLYGIDQDETSVEITRERLELSGAKPKLAMLNFRNLDKVFELFDFKFGHPTKILFDLGWSSDQFDPPAGGQGRGFSFQKDEPLLMTFKQKVGEDETTAYDVVNHWSEENLTTILFGFGEERYAKRIAKAIVGRRQEKAIETSQELAEIIKNAVPVFYRFGRIHPATRTFQAIRIAVNGELQALEEGLQKAFSILKSGGRMAVISFHSLEDRIVKNFSRSLAAENQVELINKKPIVPSEQEIKENPRSRSAKLRILKKI